MPSKQFKIDITVVEIDPTHGTGRDKDERTEIREVASISIRDAKLDRLINRAANHLQLVPEDYAEIEVD